MTLQKWQPADVKKVEYQSRVKGAQSGQAKPDSVGKQLESDTSYQREVAEFVKRNVPNGRFKVYTSGGIGSKYAFVTLRKDVAEKFAKFSGGLKTFEVTRDQVVGIGGYASEQELVVKNPKPVTESKKLTTERLRQIIREEILKERRR